mmetsp:Transcript_19176/g.29060  ORF Transcript_19176/g.29060 Transcript_19176/m.29060 type:complete len:1169 (+) Transcript_19176:58-3564(+)
MRVLRVLALLLGVAAVIQLWFLCLFPIDLRTKLENGHIKAPRWMATSSQLKELARMEPFSSAEYIWLRKIERRIRACRDSLLHFDIALPEACVSDDKLVKQDGMAYGFKKEIIVSALLTFKDSVDMTSLAITATVLALSSVSYRSEIILVDDSSTERTMMIERAKQRLSEFSGIEIRLFNTHNGPVGYSMAINFGLAYVKGSYVLLLNNDVLIFKNTVSNLLATFESRDDVGAVVPRFVGSDGKLQEAGGVVFSDGEAMHLGASLGMKNDPIFRYVRPIDYGSAACILIRRELIIGGFDEKYRPAYYEDTDLSMTLRRSGNRVLYQPFAVAMHKGSTTYNNQSLKDDLMVKNRRVFTRKWSNSLQCHYSRLITNWNNQPLRRRILQLVSRLSVFRIIFLDWNVPCFDRDSGSLRTINLIRVLLSLGAHVTFVATDVVYDNSCVYQLNWLGVHVIKQKHFDLGWGDDIEVPCDYDIIFVSRRNSFAMWKPLLEHTCFKTPIVFDTVDLHFLRELRELMATEGINYEHSLNLSNNIVRFKNHIFGSHDTFQGTTATKEQTFQYWKWLRRFSEEISLMNRSIATIVVSPIEIEIIRELKAMRRLRSELAVFHISNIHDDEILDDLNTRATNFQQRKGCLFVGNWEHTPNVDAVQFLIHEILPQIANNSETPSDFALHIVGAGEPPRWMNDIHDIGGIPVVMHGFVKDLGTILQQVRVAVAPLRYGAGVKGKVNSAMIHGVPVVATPMAIEGMFLTPNVDVIVAETGPLFATSILDLYLNYDLWMKIRTAAFLNVKKHFSVSTAKRGMHKLLDFLYVNDPHLRHVIADGTRAVKGAGNCDRETGRYGIGAIVPSNRIVNDSFITQFEHAVTIPKNSVFEADSTYLESIWALSSMDDARSRCHADRACTGWCWNPMDWTFFYFNAISHKRIQERGKLGKFPPGWTCWFQHDRIRNAPRFVRDDGYSNVHFDITSHFSYRIYKPKSSTILERKLVTSDDAQRRCIINYDCIAYCHNPRDWTFFYDDIPSPFDIMIEWGDSLNNSPGWTCYKRHKFAVKLAKPEFVKVQRPSNYVYGEAYITESLKLNNQQAQTLCAKNRRCTGYCNHPREYTWIYEMKQGAIKQHRSPPGWDCYIRPKLLESIRKGGSNKQTTYEALTRKEKGENDKEKVRTII